jgi:ParB/RepB/Spo0J family partition protein
MSNTDSVQATRLRDLKVGGISDMPKIDPRIIQVEDNLNPRNYQLAENRAHLDRLKESIREHGVQNPLWVRWDTVNKLPILVDGECRLKAVLELIAENVEIVSVPVIQKSAANPADRLVLALTANEGKPLNESEVGFAYKRLVNYGWSQEMIAKRVGKSVRYVNDAIELSEAPEEVKAMVSEGTVSKRLAIKTVRSKGEQAVDELSGLVDQAKSTGKGTAKAPRNVSFSAQVSAEFKLAKIAEIVDAYSERPDFMSLSDSQLAILMGTVIYNITGIVHPEVIEFESHQAA